MSVPQVISAYQIGRIGLMKIDIEGGEFAVFSDEEDLSWLDQVDQVVMEVHGNFGDAAALVGRLRQHGSASTASLLTCATTLEPGSAPPPAGLTMPTSGAHEPLCKTALMRNRASIRKHPGHPSSTGSLRCP